MENPFEKTLYLVLRFPNPWPPIQNISLQSGKEENSHWDITIDMMGRIVLSLDVNNIQHQYKFQPIDVRGDGKVILCLTWSNDRANLRINAQNVPIDEGNNKKFHLITKDTEDHVEQIIDFEITDDLKITNEEILFLQTLKDIQEKLNRREKYSLLRAAGLLRHLLIDQHPLVHQANRNYRLKLSFRTIDYNQKPPLTPDIQIINLDSSSFPGASTIESDLKEFLRAPCLLMNEKVATVKDVIDICANVRGGIHLGKSKPDQIFIDELDEAFKVLGGEPSLEILNGICRIVLFALKPLGIAITKTK